MSGLLKVFGARPAPAQVAGVRVQTSIAGLAIPVVYGTARISPNLIDYANWHQAGTIGGKKGGKVPNYTAAVLMALCEGPIDGIGMVWADKDTPQHSVDYAGTYGWEIDKLGFATQTPWNYWTGPLANHALPYPYTAYAANRTIQLPNDYPPHLTWEVLGLLRISTGVTWDYGHVTGGGAQTFTTNLVKPDGYYNNGMIEFRTGRLAGYIGQVTTWANAGGTVTLSSAFPVAPSSGDTFVIYCNGDAMPNAIVADVLTDPNHGLELPSSMLGDWTSFAQYCQAVGLFLSPVMNQGEPANGPLSRLFQIANCAPFWSDGTLKVVPYGDTAVTGNGITWTPNSTPLYALTDSDFLGDPPVTMQRTPSAQAYNRVTVEYEDRAFQYNSQTQEAKDDAAIAQAGMVLSMPQLSFHEIKVGSVARTVAQLALQRALYVRNTYTFTLPLNFALLEPMDLVTLTDPGLGLSAYPVRLTSVTWTEQDTLECEAEDWPFGTATAAKYANALSGGFVPDADAPPGSTNAPFIIEAPVQIATSPLDILINVSGGPNWGGCDIYVSQDDVTFVKYGTITQGSVYGALSAALSPGTNYPGVDTTNTCAVDLSSSFGSMVSQPDAAFTQLLPLCYVGNEWICYETATLTGTYQYNLTHLYRGLYGTSTIATAPIGAPFAVIDFSATGGTYRLPWPTGQEGQVLYFKFPAFNVFGKSEESLAAVTSYAHTLGVAGAILYDAIAQGTLPVAADGSWVAYIDGPTFVNSYSVATSLTAFPSDATAAASASIYNGRSVTITSGSDLTAGEEIFLTIVPWTGASATGTQLPSIHLQGLYLFGPQLTVTPTPGTASYSIAWSGTGTITLSIDGGSYAAPPTSPISVTRGSSPHIYKFQSVLNGQTVWDSVVVPELGSGTVTPDLTVTPSGPTATQQTFTVTFSNPAPGGSPAPTGTYTLIGTTASGGTIPAGTHSIASGGTVTVDRPAFATTTQASVTFTASISGGGQERIQRSIMNQVKTAFGPSLTAAYKPDPTTPQNNGTIVWTNTGDAPLTLTLSIDGATSGAGWYGNGSVPASPIAISLGATSHTYSFVSTSDGQAMTVNVFVPAAGNVVKTFGVVSGTAGPDGGPYTTLTVEWVATNFPTGTTFDIYYNNGGSSTPLIGSATGQTGTSYTFNSVTFSGTPGSGSVTVTAQYNGETLATQTKKLTYIY